MDAKHVAKLVAEAQAEHDTTVKAAKATYAEAGKAYRAARAEYRKVLADATTKLAVETLKATNPELAELLDKAATQAAAGLAEAAAAEDAEDDEHDDDNGDGTDPAVNEPPAPATGRRQRNAA